MEKTVLQITKKQAKKYLKQLRAKPGWKEPVKNQAVLRVGDNDYFTYFKLKEIAGESANTLPPSNCIESPSPDK